MKTEKVAIGKVKPNKDNPRIIKDEKFKKLVKSIQDFPEMLEIRPIVVNKDMIVLGGNMRLRACQEAGLKEVHIIKAENLTEEQQKEFIIKDNVGFGEWDWDILANEWEQEKLEDWGLEVPNTKEKNEDELNKSLELSEFKNYIILLVDNDLDKLYADTVFGFEKVKINNITTGTGTIIKLSEAIEKIKQNENK